MRRSVCSLSPPISSGPQAATVNKESSPHGQAFKDSAGGTGVSKDTDDSNESDNERPAEPDLMRDDRHGCVQIQAISTDHASR